MSTHPFNTKDVPGEPVDQSSSSGKEQCSNIISISSNGDLVLDFHHSSGASTIAAQFRIDSHSLKERSKYFSRLLGGRFGEQERVNKAISALKQQYGNNLQGVQPSTLPVIKIEDIGRISTVKSIEALCRDFLSILHDVTLPAMPPVANLANLAIVADRFDALEAIRSYMSRKKIIRAIDAKTTARADDSLPEEKVRQRLLVGLLLDYSPWLTKYSQRLVVKGWLGSEALDTDALWWDIPSRLEEELDVRRQKVLETIQSLQTHFVRRYTSRERQCRLGYDSSAQCDIFQLGQTIRFFSRIGTLQAQSTIAASDPIEPYQGDVLSLIDSMRQCPEYQVDAHHSHCGIRTKLLPLLDLITEALLHVGVCADCWTGNRSDSWVEAKPPLLWTRANYRLRNLTHKDIHENIRVLFSAAERDWNA